MFLSLPHAFNEQLFSAHSSCRHGGSCPGPMWGCGPARHGGKWLLEFVHIVQACGASYCCSFQDWRCNYVEVHFALPFSAALFSFLFQFIADSFLHPFLGLFFLLHGHFDLFSWVFLLWAQWKELWIIPSGRCVLGRKKDRVLDTTRDARHTEPFKSQQRIWAESCKRGSLEEVLGAIVQG